MVFSQGSLDAEDSLQFFSSDAARGHTVECGVDLVDIPRIGAALERWGDKFLRRIWTEREIAYANGRYPELSVRFAAKEAVSKVLGTGIDGIIWREIEVTSNVSGKPHVTLHGSALERAHIMGIRSLAVSLTHSRSMACAVVVALLKDGREVGTQRAESGETS